MTLEKPSPQDWLQKRQPEIINILSTLKQLKTFTVEKPAEDLNQLHVSISGLRNYQEWVKTYLVNAIGMELEVKRLCAVTEIEYKDALGKAFTEKADVVSLGKSFEEKLLRLRQYIPVIREKEEWEAILESVGSFKQAVQLVYDDLSRGAMSTATQVNVIKSQILTGQIKIQIEGNVAKSIISENALDSLDRAAIKNTTRGEGTLETLL
jgi:hypothetical protein